MGGIVWDLDTVALVLSTLRRFTITKKTWTVREGLPESPTS